MLHECVVCNKLIDPCKCLGVFNCNNVELADTCWQVFLEDAIQSVTLLYACNGMRYDVKLLPSDIVPDPWHVDVRYLVEWQRASSR